MEGLDFGGPFCSSLPVGFDLILFLLLLLFCSVILGVLLVGLVLLLILLLLMLSSERLGCLISLGLLGALLIWMSSLWKWVVVGYPLLDIFHLPPLTGDVLVDVVRKKKSTAGGLDKALPLPWFDGLACILRLVEETGVWPDGLLDAYVAMISKSGGDATPLGQRPFVRFTCGL